MDDKNNKGSFDPVECVLWLLSTITLIGFVIINITK